MKPETKEQKAGWAEVRLMDTGDGERVVTKYAPEPDLLGKAAMKTDIPSIVRVQIDLDANPKDVAVRLQALARWYEADRETVLACATAARRGLIEGSPGRVADAEEALQALADNPTEEDFPPAEWVALMEEGGQIFVEARDLGLYLSQPRRPLDDYTEAQREVLRRIDDLQARFAAHGGEFHVDDELDMDAAIFRDAFGRVVAFASARLDELKS